MTTSAELKAQIAPYRAATADFENTTVRTALSNLCAPDATLKICHPFGTLAGPEAYFASCLAPLHAAMPDLERRDMILLAGTTPEGQAWVGTMGNYMGTFLAPFIDIPPTGRLAHVRYHEFFRMENGRMVEIQAIWDLPELMMQAHAWPMAPQLGAYLCTPAPMSGDGLTVTGDGQAAHQHVVAMIADMCKHPANPDPKVMQLEKYWHPRFNWYGPAGIGTGRGIAGFRNWHQIPFLRAMPNRTIEASGHLRPHWEAEGGASSSLMMTVSDDLTSHWVAEGNYVCETGWPNMRLTLSGDGWMGIAPAGKEVFLSSLDFWRMENGLIRENWVLIDLLDLYSQIGVDVLERVREFNKARNIGTIVTPDGLTP